MTKQQWEAKASEIQNQIDQLEDNESYQEYLEAKRNACYSAAVDAIDEDDLSAEELKIFKH